METLTVQPRTILGKKVNRLRRQGITPANLYGAKVASTPIQADTKQLLKVLRSAGRTTLIGLQIADDPKPRQAFAWAWQNDPMTGTITHVDFYQVEATQRIRAEVPVAIIGEAPAVKMYYGVLTQHLHSLEVESLPADLPHEIKVDVSTLQALEDEVRVRQLQLGPSVKVLAEPDQVLVKVHTPRAEVEEKPAAPEATVAEKAEAEAAKETKEEG